MLRLVQLIHPQLGRRVAVVEEPRLRLLRECESIYELAQSAIRSNQQLCVHIESLASDEAIAYDSVYGEQVGTSDAGGWKLLPPIDHPEPSRCFVTGTGLTHRGSAENRQSMHVAAKSGTSAGTEPLSDSMKMFQIEMEGGRPSRGSIGAAPEWFYKGVGTIVRAHNESLDVPVHGLDGGEEAEIAGVYVIGPNGSPFRIGLVQGNEFSDHIMEAMNYLYLAPSKLRHCALGPELVVDARFDDVPGETRIERDGQVIWQSKQASGEQAMCHSLANLEHHHFKYAEHRRPGDLHIHFFGADMFSFKDRLRLEDGDVMSISFEGFGRPLRNPIRIDSSESEVVNVNVL
jgi:hypothetical protein